MPCPLTQIRARLPAPSWPAEKAAAAPREVFVPPLVIHPDSSVHLVYCGHLDGCPPRPRQEESHEQQQQQGDRSAASGSAASGSWHGRTLLVTGTEAAFARVSVHAAVDLELGSDDTPPQGSASTAVEPEQRASFEAAAARHRLESDFLAAEAAASKGAAA